ncbi:glycosyltransferase family 4 protein [Vibrio hannami]|uniref:glycosyltransferase family 4 protein n=1 Tax=Vibrio hannami TaxID=2717094 RepID=UPI0024109BEE|nr:glycosyltransferase family 4 protein [Vibrio hannami]MDG3087037.1 glycosyltransferase family 4 protein [Vibrio hannami]
MKILQVNKFFFMKGGAETVYFQEKEMLQSAGYETIEFSMDHEKNFASDYADFFVENVDYHREGSKLAALKTAINFIHNKDACTKMQALLEQEKPDLVHFHNIYHQLTPSVIKVAKKFGCKTVLTAHDSKIVCPNYTMYRDGKTCEKCLHGSFLNATRYRCQEGSLAKSALLTAEALYQKFSKNYSYLDAIVAPSAFLGNLIKQKLPDARIEVIVNGVDENVAFEESTDKGYFLYLGRLSDVKGVHTLAKAHQLMEHNAELRIVGDGPLYNKIKQSYPSAQLYGFQSGEALINLIKGAKAVVVPSEWSENCSMSVLEALAYGKPVIGSRIGGIPEQIRDGIDGYLFEAANPIDLAKKMDQLVIDKSASIEMGKNARERLLQKYSLTRHKEALIELYKKLLEE